MQLLGKYRKMEIFKILLNRSPFFYFFILILGGINSVLNSSLLIFINNTLGGKPFPVFPGHAGVMFAGMILFAFLINRTFQIYMVKLTNQIVLEFELSVLKTLKGASLESYERLGSERVLTAINDTRILSNLPQVFINTFTSVVTVICCLAYLFYISPAGGISTLVLILGLLFLYLIRNGRIMHELNRIRDLKNDYYKYLNDLLYGFREVKMSHSRSNTIYNDYLKSNKVLSTKLEVDTSVKYMNNELVGKYSLYIVLGVVLFGLPRIVSMNFMQVTAYIVTLLYLLAPVSLLINALPFYSGLRIALSRLREFDESLRVMDKAEHHEYVFPDERQEFQKLELRKVAYEYSAGNDQDREFSLGPLDLKIEKGEVVFITGGNGSGKSTFLKLLAGLYTPKEGSLLLNGRKISGPFYPYYRDQIAVVFSNHYLFSENYDRFDLENTVSDLSVYTRMLQMEEVVRMKSSGKSINHNLSRGQQKRLSLIYALMENKEILLLDEWAAEQDPRFKAYFYEKLLPEFKKAGKTVIAVTHDDEYFSHADRIIHFNSGKITGGEYLIHKQNTVTEPADE